MTRAARSNEDIARYFPVEAAPLRMLPRLRPFGTDWGNGGRDRLFFQRDALAADYRAAKCRPTQSDVPSPCERLRLRVDNDDERRAHQSALAWAARTLEHEHPGSLGREASEDDLKSRWHELGLAVQEDLVLVQRGRDETDRVLAVQVCFPSNWRPETILGWDFRAIHAPVPDFADRADTARSLATAMIERGPYERFVWTLCADAELDHHPEWGARVPWSDGARRGWLRVERQVTVPLASQQAAIFLIRTYLTAFEQLEPPQRKTLLQAVERMPEAVRDYKGVLREPVSRALCDSGPLA